MLSFNRDENLTLTFGFNFLHLLNALLIVKYFKSNTWNGTKQKNRHY